MEVVPVKAPRQFFSKAVSDDRIRFKIQPSLGLVYYGQVNGFSQCCLPRKGFQAAIGVSSKIRASADFARKRPKRILAPSPRGPAPKGFMPKSPVGTSSTHRREQRNNGEEEEGPTTSSSIPTETITSSLQSNQVKEDSRFEEEDVSSEKNPNVTVQRGTEGVSNEDNQIESEEEEESYEDDNANTDESKGLVTIAKSEVEDTIDEICLEENYLRNQNGKKQVSSAETEASEPESAKQNEILESREKEGSLSLKMDMEASMRKELLARLANENFSRGNKMFYHPEVVRPGQDIEVFFNRSLSILQNEPEIMIMGAFNDWRCKYFTNKLNKSNLSGDWWSSHIHVPSEAYKMDFVFFNGNDVYDNNKQTDFCITVEGGMDRFDFEDFLLQEKSRELEKLAKEQAERERQAEEQTRIEAVKAAIEADRVWAKEEIQRRRDILQESRRNAVRSIDNVWYIEPNDFKEGDLVRLFYNKGSGPLAHAKDLWIHGGHNNWMNGLSIVTKLERSYVGKEDADWWYYADVTVPDRAFVLDWVFANGPPKDATVYDNNLKQDFHAIVPRCIPEDLYWVEEEERTLLRLKEERRLKEEAILEKAERTACMKAETKERTLKRFLLSLLHIVYTDPLDVQAGGTVTVFYNPSNTILNGKSEIWFRGSFNRWTHRMGPLPPQKMLPADNDSHVKAIVKVPLDAYMLDFVFSEREDGGIFDNKDGTDYHVPVFGGVGKEPPMHIVHIAIEMAPIAKVGGLGDVVTSLSRAVQDLNHNVDIILPKYDCLKYNQVKNMEFHKSYSWGGTEIKVWFGKVEELNVYFLEPQNGLFWKGCIYGSSNDAERFGFFCHAALEFLLQSRFHPDIIHCHDWSSAPVAWLFKDQYMHYGLSKARVVFTIHNLEFGQQFIGKAMTYSDKATTVSPTYSKEVAGSRVVAPHLHKFHGILNGIDLDIWDPYNDMFLPVPYTSENVVEGKMAAKHALQQRLGLKTADVPVVGIITRLTHQKGIHLIKHAIWRTLERHGQVVLLGSAPDPKIQNEFVNLANRLHSSHGDHARLVLTYDEPLSHLIYAGSDFMLVPSIFEPCGLTQLTAMRYGSVPVVRKTGGLYDTVFDVDHDKERAKDQGLEPNGFNFDGADSAGVDYALNRAITSWYDEREWFNLLCKRVMEQDWSWNRPALDYLELYHAARKY
ncbi:starch synthase 3, chloroplastic/amyloplastic [Impatiens glandulifera]|uniref:starch synthase 3, chloroplastic/amyloplastic n=1 Tax=Impatiens glandulifera TaxID=253017 RepID=UPI001FB0A60F|nr:starch synthase 3, chloroplastic/amyloplastic [Impatiens glandulifera]